MTNVRRRGRPGAAPAAAGQQAGERYSRQMNIPFIGREGQEKISRGTAAIVGVGGLGSVAAELLCRAGVGSLLLIDHDAIEESNLARQSLYTEDDVGKKKAVTAAKRLQDVNSKTKITTSTRKLTTKKDVKILDGYDVVLDCTDNLDVRLLLNAYCVREQRPFVHCAVVQSRVRVLVVDSRMRTACLACLLAGRQEEAPPARMGIIVTTVHVGASLQANAALQLLLGETPSRNLVSFDAWTGVYHSFTIERMTLGSVVGTTLR